jgi:predicted cupin superfamily sugar epimerase
LIVNDSSYAALFWFLCYSFTCLLNSWADGELSNIRLDIYNEERFQAVVKSGHWFAASVDDVTSYSLAGCIVSPGYDY